MRSRLVEHEDRSIREEGAGESDPLALTPGHLSTLLADERVPAVRQLGDPVLETGAEKRRLELGVGSLGPREDDVLADGGREEMRVLAGYGNCSPDVFLAELAQVASAERYASLLGIEEAKQEVDDRRLAGSTLPDQSDSPPWLEAKVEAGEHRVLVRRVPGS